MFSTRDCGPHLKRLVADRVAQGLGVVRLAIALLLIGMQAQLGAFCRACGAFSASKSEGRAVPTPSSANASFSTDPTAASTATTTSAAEGPCIGCGLSS
jgi:hypothetical protein